MTRNQEIQNTLAKMAALLRQGNIPDWAEALERLSDQIVIDPDDAIYKVLSSYGGMGSLNDLVLHKDGIPLVEENNELDALRSQLFALCHARDS